MLHTPSFTEEGHRLHGDADGQLGGAIAALEEDRKRLQAELTTERHRVSRLLQKLTSLGFEDHKELLAWASRPQPQLHVIVLRHVFEYLVPPPGVLDHSFSYGPNSAWHQMIRTWKSLALVCKLWNSTMIPLLYRDVVFRRVGQLAAFARTIRSAPRTFATHVRSLTLHFPVPDLWVSITRQLFAQIADECLQLDTLSLQGLFPAKTILSYGPEEETSCAASLLSRLSRLDAYGTHLCYFDPGRHAQFFTAGTYTQLTSLTIFVGWQEDSVDPDSSWKSGIHFPNLTTLVLRSYITPFHNLPQSWDLPKLLELRLRLSGDTAAAGSMSLLDFSHKYSSTLRNLDFSGSCRIPLQTQLSAAASCTYLDHLVLTLDMDRSTLGSPSVADLASLRASAIFMLPLRLVDIVVPRPFPRDTPFAPRLDADGCAWACVRFLDGHTVARIPDLPYLVPAPDASQRRAALVFDFYGVRVREAHHCIELVEGWEDITSIYPSSGSERSEDLSDSEFEDSDEMEDSSGQSCNDVTEEEALAIFESTLGDSDSE